MDELLQQLVNGAFIGCVYGLFALGFTLVFGVLDIINLAHPAVFTLGGLSALYLTESLGLPLSVAFFASSLASGLLGLLLDAVAFAPLRRRGADQFSGMIASIGMAILFEAAAIGFFGAKTVRFPKEVFPNEVFVLGPVTVTLTQILIVVVALVLMTLLTLLLGRTRLGKAIRAVAENQQTAALLGINVKAVIRATFFMSSALGGAAGILYGLYFDSLSPDMGRNIELKGLAVIILGGMGSIPGCIIGGLAFGLSEVLTVAVTGASGTRDAVAFLALFLILLVRPTGILGRGKTREG